MRTTTDQNRDGGFRIAPAGYEPLHPSVLNRLDRWDIDVFVLNGQGSPVLLRDSNLGVDADRIKRLIDRTDRQLFVSSADFQSLSVEVMSVLDSLVSDLSLPEADRFSMLQTAAAAEVETASNLIDPTRFVKVSEKLGRNLSELIQNGTVVPAEVYQVARHDHHTFTHVTNVCCYALVLADALGMNEAGELDDIAVGALLHDCGKRHIPSAILKKPGRLTDSERAIIQHHAQQGYEDLVTRYDLSHAQLLMVYQHHEWVNGEGYPVGILGEEMHPWSRLLAIVDVFDALTGRRPYRQPLSSEEALDKIVAGSGTQFDEEMVACWNQIMRS